MILILSRKNIDRKKLSPNFHIASLFHNILSVVTGKTQHLFRFNILRFITRHKYHYHYLNTPAVDLKEWTGLAVNNKSLLNLPPKNKITNAFKWVATCKLKNSEDIEVGTAFCIKSEIQGPRKQKHPWKYCIKSKTSKISVLYEVQMDVLLRNSPSKRGYFLFLLFYFLSFCQSSPHDLKTVADGRTLA